MRRVEVDWDKGKSAPRRVRITVHSQDQMGLLASVSQACTTQGANITSAQIETEHGRAAINFELTVQSAEQLNKVKRAIEMVPGVIKVERVRTLSSTGKEEEGDL